MGPTLTERNGVFILACCVGLVVCVTATSDWCPSEYSWTAKDKQYGYNTLKEDMCGSTTVCWSPFLPPQDSDSRPPPIESDPGPTYSFFGKVIGSNTNTTCLRVEYSLPRHSSKDIKGLQFMLHGKGYNSHNIDCCQMLNYTVPLGYDAVYDDVAGVEDPHRRFVFDCFCDLWPDEDYALSIRTLPVDQTLVDDSKYVIDFKVPKCTPESGPDRSWDQYCKKSKEERWKPQIIEMNQQFPEYDVLDVKFNIAPSDYRFISYVVSLYKALTQRPVHHKLVLVNSGNFVEETMTDTTLRVNTSTVVFNLGQFHDGEEYYVGIMGKCLPAEKDCVTPSIETFENPISVIANPCDANLCERNSSCVPDRENYTCFCLGTDIFDGSNCIENPCARNPCGEMGHCELTQITFAYTCNCSDDYIFNGQTCIPEPCLSNPCDAFSVCRVDDDFNHQCTCPKGVTCVIDKCATTKLPWSPCITMATCDSKFYLRDDRKFFDCGCEGPPPRHTNVTEICVENTCSGSSCSEHGVCSHSLTDTGGVKYNCSCQAGFVMDYNGTCQKSNDTVLLVILLIAVGLVLVAIIIGVTLLIRKNSRTSKLCSFVRYERNGEAEKPIHYSPVRGAMAGAGAEHLGDEVTRVLLIATEETEMHRDIVYKFAAFLNKHGGVQTVVPSQNKKEVHRMTLETWLSSENQKASKVIFLCSQGTRECWDAVRNCATPNVGGELEFGDVFRRMLTITTLERETRGKLDKFVTAFFSEYSSKGDVLDIFSGLPCFVLMRDLESLCFNLIGKEQFTPTSSRRMPVLREYDMTPEGRALFDTLRGVKNYTSPSRRLGLNNVAEVGKYRSLPPGKSEEPPSLTDDGVVDDLGSSIGYSIPSPLQDLPGDGKPTFQTIPLDERVSMVPLKNLFCSESSGSEGDAYSLELNVDVHCDDFTEVQGIDSGFQSSRDPSGHSELALMKVLQLSNSSLSSTL